jgi:hypothetical protein
MDPDPDGSRMPRKHTDPTDPDPDPDSDPDSQHCFSVDPRRSNIGN